ncbi:MAG: adenylate/guanylate cyclase domain-containing protein [Desulfococcaceae bacterium]
MKLFIYIFILLFPSVLWAGSDIEILEKKLLRADESESLVILNEMSAAYWETLPKKSIVYGQEALRLAQKLADRKQEALALRNIGVAHRNLSDYDKALEYLLNSLKIRKELEDPKEIADSLHHMGIVYDYLNNFEKALEYHHNALEIEKEIGYQEGIAASLHNIGIIHHLSSRYDEALKYYKEGLQIRGEIGDRQGVAASMNNIGVLYMDISNYPEALKYFFDALKIFSEIGQNYEVANISNNIGKLYTDIREYDKALPYLEKGLEMAEKIGAKELIRENYSFFSDLHIAKADYQKALEYYKKSEDVRNSIFTAESQAKISDIQTQYETEKKQKEIELLKKDNEINRLELDRQKLLRNSLLGGFTFVLLLAAVVYNRYLFKKKAHAKLEEAHRLIMEEKAKSDKLLLNILPVRVANDLKEKGKTEPESFENVTVYFSDVVGFTNLSSHLDPKVLIGELNDIFTAFDNIIEKHECERVKTIGDAYLCVCGMPEENPNHAENMMRAAIEIIRYLRQRNTGSEIQWRIRIGIHTGRVVGGVVGIKKYIYDVFGDTINTASRMESNSEPMKINVSEATYLILKDRFPFVERATVSVKGKGEMKMFFVDDEAFADRNQSEIQKTSGIFS